METYTLTLMMVDNNNFFNTTYDLENLNTSVKEIQNTDLIIHKKEKSFKVLKDRYDLFPKKF